MTFSDNDKQRLKTFYTDLLTRNGLNNPRSLGWNSEYTQQIRFSVLSQIDGLENSSILDIGCGLGDLYGYLKQRLTTFTYTGIDMLPEMIEGAKASFPEADFRVFDFNTDMKEQYDFVLSSGLLSYKIDNAKEVYLAMIQRMFAIAKKGVAYNMLDKKNHPDDDTFIPYSPTEIYEYCSKLTDKIVLRHDYLDYDFTVYLYH